MSRTPLKSSRLAELKYTFFSGTGRKTKKLRRSNLFPLTIFKYGLLEGLTFFISIQLNKLYTVESSRVGEQKNMQFQQDRTQEKLLQLSHVKNSRRISQEATNRTGDTDKCLPNKWEIRPTRKGLANLQKGRYESLSEKTG